MRPNEVLEAAVAEDGKSVQIQTKYTPDSMCILGCSALTSLPVERYGSGKIEKSITIYLGEHKKAVLALFILHEYGDYRKPKTEHFPFFIHIDSDKEKMANLSNAWISPHPASIADRQEMLVQLPDEEWLSTKQDNEQGYRHVDATGACMYLNGDLNTEELLEDLGETLPEKVARLEQEREEAEIAHWKLVGEYETSQALLKNEKIAAQAGLEQAENDIAMAHRTFTEILETLTGLDPMPEGVVRGGNVCDAADLAKSAAYKLMSDLGELRYKAHAKFFFRASSIANQLSNILRPNN